MATDKQNWTKAYNKKNPNATAAARKAAFEKWQKARSRGTTTKDTSPGATLPSGWGMTRGPDVLGSWANRPNLDPTEYEIEQGQDKKFYARKRTELTGLEGYQKQAIAKWDADAAARSGLMSGVETQAVNASRAIGDSGAARMADLATLIQASPQSQALGGVSTSGGTTQQTSSPDQAASGEAAGSAARLAAVQMATSAQEQAKNAPTLAGYSMASLTNQARSNDSATRQKLLSAFRQSNTEAQSAKDTAIARTYSDQARLLAAAIQSGARLTAEQIQQMGENFRTTQSNETSLANNAADNETSVTNTTTTANNDARAKRVQTTNDFVGKIVNRIDGVLSTTVDSTGKETEKLTGGGEMPMSLINEALSRKIPLGPVLSAIAGTNRGKAIRKPRTAMQIYQKMIAAGIPRRTALLTIQRNLGVNLAPGGGVVAGPPSPRR